MMTYTTQGLYWQENFRCNPVLYHLPSVSPKHFCALAQSECTHEAGSLSISLIPPKLFLASCMKVKGKQRCVFLTQHFAALTYLLGI